MNSTATEPVPSSQLFEGFEWAWGAKLAQQGIAYLTHQNTIHPENSRLEPTLSPIIMEVEDGWKLANYLKGNDPIGDIPLKLTSMITGGSVQITCTWNPENHLNQTSTWRIIPVSKWLISMVSKSPKWGYSPYKWPFMAYKWGWS